MSCSETTRGFTFSLLQLSLKLVFFTEGKAQLFFTWKGLAYIIILLSSDIFTMKDILFVHIGNKKSTASNLSLVIEKSIVPKSASWTKKQNNVFFYLHTHKTKWPKQWHCHSVPLDDVWELPKLVKRMQETKRPTRLAIFLITLFQETCARSAWLRSSSKISKLQKKFLHRLNSKLHCFAVNRIPILSHLHCL